MRPTGPLHLGHLVGALESWVRLQDTHEAFYVIVDWHALTTEYANPAPIRDHVQEVALDWLAAGIDPERSTLFVQSDVKQHAELHLILSMIVPLPWLERVPSYKEQQEQLRDRDLNTYGFLGYPLLQAADILIYKAEIVPVGEDQVPHLELTREIARRFNHTYRPIFPEPQALLTPAARLPGTDGRKMSKSYHNAIYLRDPEPEIRRKVDSMLTDPARTHRHIPGNPEICPVFQHHRTFSPETVVRWAAEGCRTAGIGCRECKAALSDSLWQRLQPLAQRRASLETDRTRLAELLQQGAEKARAVAESTMAEVRQAVGLTK